MKRTTTTALILLHLLLAPLTPFAAEPAPQQTTAFGTTRRAAPGTASLIGIFYDLKQTQQRQPIPKADRAYAHTIDEFLVTGLDESVLNRHFRAATPLYTTQFNAKMMEADAAPKAFGVGDIVQPKYWIIHYKGQVSPPSDGTYRFVGSCDDVLVVAINGKIVLVGNLPDTRFPRLGWKEQNPGPRVAANGRSVYGDWLDLKASQPLDIDILVGERPGGHFFGILLYEKRGETYPLNSHGQIILPLFQLAPAPDPSRACLTDRPPWKCYE